jgi:hypothetical protein
MIRRNIEPGNNDESQQLGCPKGTKKKKVDYKQGIRTRRPTR